jgi:hypothetical protein
MDGNGVFVTDNFFFTFAFLMWVSAMISPMKRSLLGSLFSSYSASRKRGSQRGREMPPSMEIVALGKNARNIDDPNEEDSLDDRDLRDARSLLIVHLVSECEMEVLASA